MRPAALRFRPVLNALDLRVVPAVLYVDDDHAQKANAQYTTIQSAVNAAHDGDTIRVYAGTYAEQVRVGKPGLTLEAVGKQVVVTPPAGGVTGSGVMVAVLAGTRDVTIDGFQLFGASAGAAGSLYAGIAVDVGGSATIRDNTITAIADQPLSGVQSGLGILLNGADATVADNTVALYQKAGIVAFGPGTVTITGNTVAGAGPTATIAQVGIQASDGVTATIRGNLVSGNSYTPDGTQSAGVVVNAAGPVTVADNKLVSNGVGFAAESQTAGLVVSGNRVTGSAVNGISLTDTSAATVRGNTVTQTGDQPITGVQIGLGILLDGSSATVTNNTVSKYQKAGIVAFGPGTVTITGNTVTGVGKTDVIAQVGIQVSFGVNALVSGNDVSKNAYTGATANGEAAGISVYQAGVVTVTGNTVTADQIGIAVESQTAGVLVSGNQVTRSTTDGIRLTDTQGAVVLSNQVTGSGRYGIAVTGGSKNVLVALNRATGSGTYDLFDGTSPGSNVVFIGNRYGTRN